METMGCIPSMRIEGNSISLRGFFSIMLMVMGIVSIGSGQPTVFTGRMDNQRSGANLNETMLTPSNVNSNQFGAIFNYQIDYLALAQPLYVPNVNINGTLHNVVYVATMADSVYAFDADSNTGSNASPLWWVNFTNPAIYGPGITTANTIATLPCSGGNTTGFTQEGIAGTPVIDTSTGTLYAVAKTVENGAVVHRLHALDITNGTEKFSGPVVISASSSYLSPVNGKTYNTTFNSLHQLNRPGLLLMNGAIYIGFGSNGCNDGNTGWLLSYSAASLTPISVFNTSPEHGLVSIWQTGNGIAADENNNIFVETAEACTTCYDVYLGGATYSNSVVELDPNSLTVTDYFTPYDVQFLNRNDQDLSSTGVLILPDLEGGTTPHELVAGGKQGFVYVINRDAMGGYDTGVNCSTDPSCDDVLQEFPLIPGAQQTKASNILFSSPAYWNNTVYFAPDDSPLLAYPVSSGTVPLGPAITTTQKYVGSHSPSISANGSSNGILWVLSGGNLYALNALNMQLLYASNQIKSRDALPPVAHFVTQTVVNGKAYVVTQTTLSVYGLLPTATVVSGANQSAQVLTALPAPIQVQVVDPYLGIGVPGMTVTFSDGGKNGSFNPASTVSDSNGNVSTTYTLGKTAAVYTITATLSNNTTTNFAETSLPGPAKKLVLYAGTKQTGQAGSILPSQLRVRVEDAYNNGVPGVTGTFVDKSGAGTLNPSSALSNSTGFVMASYQLPNADGTYKISANASGVVTTVQFVESATGDAPASLSVVSGSNQLAPANTVLPQPLVALVSDESGNPVSGVSVVFSASSGTFTGNPALTGANGQASVGYTTGANPGSFTITANVNGLTTQFAENVTTYGAPASVTVSGGNSQTGAAGTALPLPLTVVVADQYGNPVPNISVLYSDNGSGGTFSSPNPANTDNTGTASVSYTLSRAVGAVSISATAAGVNNAAMFSETSVSGSANYISVTGGNNQTAPAGTQLPQALTILVTDQYGNPVSGASVNFSDGGAGGVFSNPNPVVTNGSGIASQMYTLPQNPGTISISASAAGVTIPGAFTETGQ